MSDHLDKFSCILCDKDNEDDPVECTRCKAQFHRSCVEINDNIPLWICDKCKALSIPPAPRSHRSKSVISRSSTNSRELAFKKLEEEQRLLEETLNERLRIQQEFLQRKYDILQQEGSRSYASSVSSRNKVESWLHEHVNDTDKTPPLSSTVVTEKNGNLNAQRDNQFSATRIVVPQREKCIPVISASQEINKSYHPDFENRDKVIYVPGSQSFEDAGFNHPSGMVSNSTTACSDTKVTQSNTQPQSMNLMTTYMHKNSRMSSNENNMQTTYVVSSDPPSQGEQTAKNVTFGQSSYQSSPYSARTTLHRHDISQNAIAARQITSRDLPEFSGSPRDWPEFIAAYEFTTNLCEISEYENAGRLSKCLKGIAFDAVKNILYLDGGATGAIDTLWRLFGQPEFVINELLEELRLSEKPNVNSFDTIIGFSLKVEGLCASMKKASLNQHLSNPMLLQELVGYLPTNFIHEWAQYKFQLATYDLEVFCMWLKTKTNALLGVLQRAPLQPKSTQGNLNLHQEPVCKICQANCSSVANCSKFKEENLSRRWDLVKDLGLCRTCLKFHRGACRNKEKCGIDGCEYFHHKLLHNYRSSKNVTSVKDNEASLNLHKEAANKTFFKIVPITLIKNNKHLQTFAILDDCSSLTLLEQSLSDELGLIGQTFPLHLKWTGETTRTEATSQLVCVEISGKQSSKVFKLDRVRTVENLNLPSQTQSPNEFEKYSHLKGVPLPSFSNAIPRMLIGLSHAKLLSSTKVKMGNDDEPLAAKTPLGWVVYGASSENPNQVLHITEQVTESILDEEVKKYFALESLGVCSKQCEDVYSRDELKAKSIMENTIKFNGSNYEMGLLWKFGNMLLPKSYEMARKRLDHLESKLNKDSQLSEFVTGLIDEYLKKGYARVLSKEEVQLSGDNCWYLPMFIVRNPNKPEKIRLVWDAAAKSGNVSLNNMLLKGPDTLLSLPGILRRFRENKVAFTGDIREMFHQVRIRAEDQQYQRFLWRFDKSKEPSVLCMNVMTFGATCSPTCANYVLKINADRFKNEFPDAVKSINNSHYVDDLLEGRNTVEEAIQLAKNIKHIHQLGGFDIRNWLSNDQTFLKALNEDKSTLLEDKVEFESDHKMEKVYLSSIVFHHRPRALGSF